MDKDLATLWNYPQDELYRVLGSAVMGTRSIGDALQNRRLTMAAAAADSEAGIAHLDSTAEETGKSVVDEILSQARSIICGIYNAYQSATTDEEKHTVLAGIVGTVAAAVDLPIAVVSIALVIIVRWLFDTVCGEKN